VYEAHLQESQSPNTRVLGMYSFCVLFPANSDALREPDPEFHREMQALDDLGIPWRVVDLHALIAGRMEKAFEYFGDKADKPLLYRGWILHPGEYASLHQVLQARGCSLITSPEAYRSALLFPEYFSKIEDCSFPAVWVQAEGFGELRDAHGVRLGRVRPGAASGCGFRGQRKSGAVGSAGRLLKSALG
jgi:hypothetical protein